MQIEKKNSNSALSVKIVLYLFLLIYLPIPIHAKNKILQKKSEYNIIVLYWSINIPGQVLMKKGLEKELEKINKNAAKAKLPKINIQSYIAGDGEKGQEKQIKQMNNAILKKPDLIIVQPTDSAALSHPLQNANKANIPVIAFDQYIIGGKLISFLTSDNYQAGFLNGEYIASLFKNSKIVKIIMVEYPYVSSTVERVNGFINALEQAKQKYKIIATYEAVEPIGGKQVGNKILIDFPEKQSIDVIFTVNDGGGLAVIDTLFKAGRTEIFSATVDGDPLSIVNIKKGRLTKIDSAQFCLQLGSETMKCAYKFLQGKQVAPHILLPVFPIIKENINLYTGWHGVPSAEYTKEWKSIKPIWKWKLKKKMLSKPYFEK